MALSQRRTVEIPLSNSSRPVTILGSTDVDGNTIRVEGPPSVIAEVRTQIQQPLHLTALPQNPTSQQPQKLQQPTPTAATSSIQQGADSAQQPTGRSQSAALSPLQEEIQMRQYLAHTQYLIAEIRKEIAQVEEPRSGSKKQIQLEVARLDPETLKFRGAATPRQQSETAPLAWERNQQEQQRIQWEQERNEREQQRILRELARRVEAKRAQENDERKRRENERIQIERELKKRNLVEFAQLADRWEGQWQNAGCQEQSLDATHVQDSPEIEEARLRFGEEERRIRHQQKMIEESIKADRAREKEWRARDLAPIEDRDDVLRQVRKYPVRIEIESGSQTGEGSGGRDTRAMEEVKAWTEGESSLVETSDDDRISLRSSC